jgi:hypothetical protein
MTKLPGIVISRTDFADLIATQLPLSYGVELTRGVYIPDGKYSCLDMPVWVKAIKKCKRSRSKRILAVSDCDDKAWLLLGDLCWWAWKQAKRGKLDVSPARAVFWTKEPGHARVLIVGADRIIRFVEPLSRAIYFPPYDTRGVYLVVA